MSPNHVRGINFNICIFSGVRYGFTPRQHSRVPCGGVGITPLNGPENAAVKSVSTRLHKLAEDSACEFDGDTVAAEATAAAHTDGVDARAAVRMPMQVSFREHGSHASRMKDHTEPGAHPVHPTKAVLYCMPTAHAMGLQSASDWGATPGVGCIPRGHVKTPLTQSLSCVAPDAKVT